MKQRGLLIVEETLSGPSSYGLETLPLKALESQRGREASAFYLDPTQFSDSGQQALERIRTARDLEVYLKPVIVLTGANPTSATARILDQADMAWNPEAESKGLSEEQQQHIRRLERNVKRLAEISDHRQDANLTLRVLRMISTRQTSFRPQRVSDQPAGFIYPRLAPLVEGEHFEIFRILQQLRDEHMLEGEFVSHLYQCNNCDCSFLNFVETCPDCESGRLDVDDLTHHFQCAYTAPHQEFQQGGRLVCPKCEDELRQLGVDYEKPSLVYTCHECHNVFQEPLVQTTCFHCGHQAQPEEQTERRVYELETTARGNNAARHGLEPAFLSRLRRETRVLEWDTFKVILQGERARIQRYQNTESSLLLMKLEGLDELQPQLGSQAENVLGELVEAFEQAVRDSDFLAVYQESVFGFLLTETDQQGGQQAGQRLLDNIQAVLQENLEDPPQPSFRVATLTESLELNQQIERLLED